MAQKLLKKQVLELRNLGYSYNLIMKKLGVPKSTLSDWLKDIPFEPIEFVKKRILGATKQLTSARKRDKLISIANAKLEAIKELPNLTKRDLWMLGLGLYIGEGSKSDGVVRFVNSDPQTIKLIIRWFLETLDLKRENLRPSIHIYPDNNEIASKNYWSKITGVPVSQFAKTQIDTRLNKTVKRHNKLKFGTLHLAVKANGNPRHGAFLFRKVMFWAEQAFD